MIEFIPGDLDTAEHDRDPGVGDDGVEQGGVLTDGGVELPRGSAAGPVRSARTPAAGRPAQPVQPRDRIFLLGGVGFPPLTHPVASPVEDRQWRPGEQIGHSGLARGRVRPGRRHRLGRLDRVSHPGQPLG
jgi:hypothetical protein